jgi:single-strand DNA-binding protein
MSVMSVNKMSLRGNLGANAEVETYGNFRVARLSVATTESWRTKEGERREKTTWHRVSIVNPKIIEAIVDPGYLTKGLLVEIEGKMNYTKYTKDGIDRYGAEVQVGVGGVVTMLNLVKREKQAPAAKPTPADIGAEDIPF